MSDLILVLGGGGQLGKEWSRFLEENGYNFKAYGSKELDICDQEQLTGAVEELSPALIINAAAYTNVDEAEDNRDRAFQVNGEAVKYLADACAQNDVPLIHYSTDYVLPGRKEDLKHYPQGYPEETGIDPVNVYGESKAAGERYLQERMDDYLLIRVSWLCGQYGNNFVKTMLKVGRERDQLKVVDDQLGSPSFADETVSISHELFEKGATGIYHVTSGGLLSWYDFAMEIFGERKIDVRVDPVPSEQYPTKAPRPRFSKLATTKLEAEGIAPSYWHEGLWRLLSQMQ